MQMIHDFAGLKAGTPTQMYPDVENLFRERINAIRSGLCPKPTDNDVDLIL
jgi:hypothetical protein